MYFPREVHGNHRAVSLILTACRILFATGIGWLLLSPTLAQNTTSPAAGASTGNFLTQAGAALTGSTGVRSISLTGTATHYVPSSGQATDPVTIAIGADGATTMSISGAAGNITESRPAAGVTGQCLSSQDTKRPAITASNCWSPASWALPTLALADRLSAARLAAATSHTTWEGQPVIRLDLHIDGTAHATNIRNYIESVSSRTLYLNASTLLPVAMTWNEHPGYKTYIDIPAEIRYSDYRNVEGVTVPFDIVKDVGGQKVLEITVDQVIVNR